MFLKHLVELITVWKMLLLLLLDCFYFHFSV